MNFDPAAWGLGWREGVIGLIVLVALYMLVVLLRMQRLKRKRPEVPLAAVPPVEEPGVVASTPPTTEASLPGREWQSTSTHLGDETLRRGLEAELSQLREEVDALRGEVAALRDELRQEISHVKATQTVSPLYSDAMQMATMGHDAATIAERCGIARAEAELVVALVRSQTQ